MACRNLMFFPKEKKGTWAFFLLTKNKGWTLDLTHTWFFLFFAYAKQPAVGIKCTNHVCMNIPISIKCPRKDEVGPLSLPWAQRELAPSATYNRLQTWHIHSKILNVQIVEDLMTILHMLKMNENDKESVATNHSKRHTKPSAAVFQTIPK